VGVTAVTERGAFGERYANSLMLSVLLPLDAGPRADNRIATARAESDELDAQLVVERNRIAAETEASRARLAAARERLAAAERRAVLARDVRGFVEKSFRLGESDLPTRLRVEIADDRVPAGGMRVVELDVPEADGHRVRWWVEYQRVAHQRSRDEAAAVQDGLVGLVVDACMRLPLDVIQFDDHLGHPADFGYDRLSLEQWRTTAAGAADPDPADDDPEWRAWRADRVTALLRQIRAAMTRHCPQVRLSISPNPHAFSYRMYLADWLAWVEEGLVDEVVVQIYRDSPEALARELAQPSLQQARAKVPVRIGLLAGLKGKIRPRSSTEQDMVLVRARGFEAVDLFFYESARVQRQHRSVLLDTGSTPNRGATLNP
jgi:hypothetical protein